MKIALMDDVHLEFDEIDYDRIKNTTGADVLILSGDVTVAAQVCNEPYNVDEPIVTLPSQYVAKHTRDFFEIISKEYPHIIYVAGNHEFYQGGDFNDTIADLKREVSRYPNIHFLEQESYVINGVEFIGATLWTDCNGYDEGTMKYLKSYMNDYNHIYVTDISGRRAKLTPEDTVERHVRTVRYIQTAIEEGVKNGITDFVVVTHHAPSRYSQHPRHSDYETNGGYSSDLSQFILDHPQIKLWTHGHTHKRYRYYIGSTLVASNARGYAHYEEIEPTFEMKTIDLNDMPSVSEVISGEGDWY